MPRRCQQLSPCACRLLWSHGLKITFSSPGTWRRQLFQAATQLVTQFLCPDEGSSAANNYENKCLFFFLISASLTMLLFALSDRPVGVKKFFLIMNLGISVEVQQLSLRDMKPVCYLMFSKLAYLCPPVFSSLCTFPSGSANKHLVKSQSHINMFVFANGRQRASN